LGRIASSTDKYGRIFARKSHNNQSINNFSAKQTFTLSNIVARWMGMIKSRSIIPHSPTDYSQRTTPHHFGAVFAYPFGNKYNRVRQQHKTLIHPNTLIRVTLVDTGSVFIYFYRVWFFCTYLLIYSNPKSFVNFLLPPLDKGRVGVG